MAAGEYISVQSQNESTAAELEVERHELRHNAEAELAELAQMYVARGVDPDLAEQVARQLSRDPDQALMIHAQEELGVDPTQLPSPRTAAISSFLSFSVGALIPLLPYASAPPRCGYRPSSRSSRCSVPGSRPSRFTARGWFYSGARQLVFGIARRGGDLRRRARCSTPRAGSGTRQPLEFSSAVTSGTGKSSPGMSARPLD